MGRASLENVRNRRSRRTKSEKKATGKILMDGLKLALGGNYTIGEILHVARDREIGNSVIATGIKHPNND